MRRFITPVMPTSSPLQLVPSPCRALCLALQSLHAFGDISGGFVLKANNVVAGILQRDNDLVQFGVDCGCVPITLNKHNTGDDDRSD